MLCSERGCDAKNAARGRKKTISARGRSPSAEMVFFSSECSIFASHPRSLHSNGIMSAKKQEKQNFLFSDEALLRTVDLSGTETSHNLGGISMGSSYIVELSCVFEDGQHLPCGRSSISSEKSGPLHVIETSEAEKPVTMFVESTSPESWEVLEERCLSLIHI